MKQQLLLTFFITLCVFIISPISLAQADTVIKKEYTKQDIKIIIGYYAYKHNVSASTMDKVVKCESGYNPNAVGDNGKSFGLSQIHNPSHPTITKEQAIDPKFALNFMGENISKGRGNMWTCYRKINSV